MLIIRETRPVCKLLGQLYPLKIEVLATKSGKGRLLTLNEYANKTVFAPLEYKGIALGNGRVGQF